MTRKEFIDWEEHYREKEAETMPWYYPDLDDDFKDAIRETDITVGKVLDLGMGPATQSIALAKLGFDVTATDISISAVEKAKIRAKKESVSVGFRQDDILNTKISGTFDCIFDRGVFHLMHSESRLKYANNVHNLLNDDGYLFLKCFSHKQPGGEGPYRISPEQIREYFESQLKIISINESIFHGQMQPHPKALFCILRKTT
jgi:2-polyprenyl-3-methyl-5-hydroxy-6-metoxy-1,4-benzoquinol methylase